MRQDRLSALLIGLAFLAGCGCSPSHPSPATSNIEGVITTAITQAVSRAAIFAPGSDVPNTVTTPCPEGGSITSTYNGTLPPGPSTPVVTTSKTEFNDCKSQNVIIRGDPNLLTTGEHVFGPFVGGTVSSASATLRTTGGLRFETNGTQGRAQFDCTSAITIQYGSIGLPQVSVTSTGTIAWEQPLGTPIRNVACGPSQ